MLTFDFSEVGTGWFRGASYTPLIRLPFLMLKSFMAYSMLPESRSEPNSLRFLALPRMCEVLSRKFRLFITEPLSTEYSTRRRDPSMASCGFCELKRRPALLRWESLPLPPPVRSLRLSLSIEFLADFLSEREVSSSTTMISLCSN